MQIYTNTGASSTPQSDLQPSTPAKSSPTPPHLALEKIQELFGPTPAVSVYRSAGERVEISGSVLANWASKGANFAVEELELEAEDLIRLDAAWGWRGIAIALGFLSMGAQISPRAETENTARNPLALLSDDEDTLRTGAADATPRGPWIIALPTADLAVSYDGPTALEDLTPAGSRVCILDYAQLVPGYADLFLSPPGLPQAPSDPSSHREHLGASLLPAQPESSALRTILEKADTQRCSLVIDARPSPLNAQDSLNPRIAFETSQLREVLTLLTQGHRIIIVTGHDADPASIARRETALLAGSLTEIFGIE